MKGLSPRVRGNLVLETTFRAYSRSIPARTGEPSSSSGYRFVLRVYPRAYGGTSAFSRGYREREGLSPRVRGNLRLARVKTSSVRSIPARTGEPYHQIKGSPPQRVYPRAYGGTGVGPTNSQSEQGLSPRVRGNLT